MTDTLTDEIREWLAGDLCAYAEHCLHIRDKDTDLVPLVLNVPQRHIHARLEAQLAEVGKVRALILKGRKQGASTYVAARFFHKTTHNPLFETSIIAHEAKASDTLFGMAKRFYEHLPPAVAPTRGKSNAKILTFPGLDAGYEVFTAGKRDVGRSKTPTMVHGSEVAFWADLANIAAGLLTAVPDSDGTEIILESTANGLGNAFHTMWMQAEAGLSDYIAIFVPWFWSPEYRRVPPDGFALTEAEAKYKRLHELDDAQMFWRRRKIASYPAGGERLFKQEYPATAAEAFQGSGGSFVQPDTVMEARKRTLDAHGPLVIGVDPARSEEPGADRFALMRRRGRKAFGKETWPNGCLITAAGKLYGIIVTERPAKVFIDVGGLGIGFYDAVMALQEPGGPDLSQIVVAVNFGGKPRKPVRTLPSGERAPGPYNRRAEIWMDGKAWLDDEMGADIPDDDELHADLCGPGFQFRSEQRILIESKEDMAKRGLRSPDTAEALLLTFAGPVAASSTVKSILAKLEAAEAR